MFQSYSYECSIVLKEAERICLSLGYHYVGTEHLLLALLKKNTDIKQLLNDYGVTYNGFKKVLLKCIKGDCDDEVIIYTPMLKSALLLAMNEVNKYRNEEISCFHLLWSILENDNSLAVRLLEKMNVDTFNLCNNVYSKIHKFSNKNDLLIYELGFSMIDKNYSKCVVNREKEVLKVMATLLKKEKPNPLLVGKAGVGKTAIIEELARRIKNKEVPEELYDLEIISVEVSSLVAGTKYRGEFEERMQKILRELTNTKNIVLFIDEIHSLVGAGGAEGAIKASDILKPYLARGDIRVIGATTNEEYKEYIVKDKALNRRFDVISIEEPTIKDMEVIMESVVKEYEKYYDISIPKHRINDLIIYSNKYLFNKNNPDKTINLLDTVCSKIKVRNINSNNNQEITSLEKDKERYLMDNRFTEALNVAMFINKTKKDKDIMKKSDIVEAVEQMTNIRISNNTKKDKMMLEKVIGEKTSMLGSQIKDIISDKHQMLRFNKREGILSDLKIVADILGSHIIIIDLADCSITNLLGKWGINEDNYVLKELIMYPSSIVVFNNFDIVSRDVEKKIDKALNESFFTNYKGEIITLEYSTIIAIINNPVKQKVGFGCLIDNC